MSVLTIPMRINPAGEITGYYFDSNNNYHRFLRARRRGIRFTSMVKRSQQTIRQFTAQQTERQSKM